MTVSELIEKLKQCKPDAKVLFIYHKKSCEDSDDWHEDVRCDLEIIDLEANVHLVRITDPSETPSPSPTNPSAIS